MKGQEILLCPQCGGNKVKTENTGKILFKLAIIFSVSIVLLPIGFLIFCVWFFKRYISKSSIFAFCSDCKHRWIISEEKYNEHKAVVEKNEKLQA